jgi:hypothetical protein
MQPWPVMNRHGTVRRDSGSGRSERDDQFSAFVAERRPQLVRTATQLTAGDPHLAEDLVQSTLTKLYLAWPAFQRAGNPDGYLRRTLVNALTDERRRIWRRRERSMAELPDPGHVESTAGAGHDALRVALRDLPPRMRGGRGVPLLLRPRRRGDRRRPRVLRGHGQEPDRPRPGPTARRSAGAHHPSSPPRSDLMMDLRNRFEEIAGSAVPPTAAQIDADLIRGRHALRRRRAVRTIAGSAFAVAAAVAAFSVTAVGGGPSGVAPGHPTATEPPAAGDQVQLVAYTGKQPKGFTIEKVPDGWFIGALAGKAVKAGDRDGVLVKMPLGETPDGTEPMPADGDTGWTLRVEQATGISVLLQFWQGLGLSEDQMVELGAGVHVHKGAEQGVG